MGKKKAKERKPGGTQVSSASSQKGKPKDKAKGQTQKEEPTHVDNSPKSEHDRILKEKIEKGEKKKRAQENLKKVKDLPAKEKGYAHPFASDTRKLFKIGVNFSNKTRNIETWKVVERNL